ncbi:glycosyltransferase [Paenibacillus sp. IHBB 3054]|uniref:glycosyltransferase n=1 Tax=Paenibacillus sp. IHBB 3054 TaxID=3425689 RepID=UPI003F680969
MFSLIVTTRNLDSQYFLRFLQSINEQKECIREKIELIIVNQDKFSEIPQVIKVHYKLIQSEHISLSKARNIGLANIGPSSTIIGFPDDDCWYNDSVLESVENEINFRGLDFLCCGVYDPYSKQTYGKNRKLNTRTKINIKNSLRLPISVGIFVRTDVILNKFKFDEKYGVGTDWGSGEESDLILDLLCNNKIGEFYSYDTVYHEIEGVKSDLSGRTFKYAKGNGALFVKSMKQRRQYTIFVTFIYMLLRTFVTLCLFVLNKEKRMLYFCRLNGLILGFTEGVDYYYKKNPQPKG